MHFVTNLLLKRPVITVFIIYALLILFADFSGHFSYENQSRLYMLAEKGDIVSVEGKVVTQPVVFRARKRFLLKTYIVNDSRICETVIVNSPAAYSVSYGDIVSIEGTLKKPKSYRDFDYQKYLSRNSIYVVLNVFSFEYIKSEPDKIKSFALKSRADTAGIFDAYFEKSCADVLKSLILGDKSSLSQSVKNDFINSGVIHILVVSGLHVGFISLIVVFILKFLGLSLKKSLLLSIPAVFFYVIMTGANPPALRAAVMLSCIFISLALDREPLIYNSLAFSALSILVFKPQYLFTASFQMSYGAAIGLVYFYRDISSIFKNIKIRIIKFFCSVLSVTLAVQIILMPVCMYYFGRISIISFITNILIVPLAGIILYSGVIFCISAFISKNIAAFISMPVSIILKFVLSTTNILGNLRFAVIDVKKPDILQLLFYFVFLFCLTNRRIKNRFVFSGIILAVNLLYLLFRAL
ncbi:MAG: ComEC family competence protein [Endomicrobium sp.]|nr:ComEC family competence protein [Endomicrobium sp.]